MSEHLLEPAEAKVLTMTQMVPRYDSVAFRRHSEVVA